MSVVVHFVVKNFDPHSRIHMNFLAFFSNLRNFLLVLKERSKDTKFGYVFAKRLRTTLKKFLDNLSERFANTTQTFFEKWDFQKLEKNLKKFIHLRTN